jgi:hypothetical protein
MALIEMLDSCHTKLLNGNADAGIDGLASALCRLRSSMPTLAWEELISVCRRHPICATLHEDPLTHRSFQEPRGYSGDAVMIDMVYDHAAGGIQRTPISRYLGDCPAAQAVRHRRSLIANIVDKLGGEKKPRILSIAAGHLREAELSTAFQRGQIEEWVALDQDDESLNECQRRYRGSIIRPIKGTVRQLLSGKLALGEFDFVYAAGLFDYLSVHVARALISNMFEMLKPSGMVLVANFAPSLADAGYMEAFMDWRLTYRSEQDMEALLAVLESNLASNARVFTDPWNAILYATAERSASWDLSDCRVHHAIGFEDEG